LWFDVFTQAIQILPLLMVSRLLQLVVRMIAGGTFPGWPLFLSPLLESLLWPLVSIVLLAPQRRAHDPDDNRPI
jgi:rod shape-determining protein MreD